MTKVELAYVAGIVDGEGCITVTQGSMCNDGHKRHDLFVCVWNNNKELINWLQSQMGGSSYGRNQGGNRKDNYCWRLTSKKALRFLLLLYPYLRVKKPQAKIGIEFQKQRKIYGRNHLKTNEAWEREEKLFLQIKQLNQRGRPQTPTERSERKGGIVSPTGEVLIP